VNNPLWSHINGPGYLSSSQKVLDIRLNVSNTHPNDKGTRVQYGLNISSVITGDIGLRVSGRHEDASVVYLSGNKNNAFTGSVEVSGSNNYLALRKTGGAVAVRGDVFVNNWGVLRLDESQQLLRSSNITLKNATLYHSITPKDLTTQFHRLTVSGSVGVVSFGSQGTHIHKRFLYIDELVIGKGARIEVNEWAPKRDFFLVKKTMKKAQLDALMSKIHFLGWLPGRTHLESYNKEYWLISGTPEPSTYGAIFAGLGTAIMVFRRKRRARRPRANE